LSSPSTCVCILILLLQRECVYTYEEQHLNKMSHFLKINKNYVMRYIIFNYKRKKGRVHKRKNERKKWLRLFTFNYSNFNFFFWQNNKWKRLKLKGKKFRTWGILRRERPMDKKEPYGYHHQLKKIQYYLTLQLITKKISHSSIKKHTL